LPPTRSRRFASRRCRGSKRSDLSDYTRESCSSSLGSLIGLLATSCKKIAWEVDQAPLALATTTGSGSGSGTGTSVRNASGDEQKELDLVANALIMEALASHPSCALAASEEEDTAVELNTEYASPSSSEAAGETFSVVFDPLDGSRNIECNIPTGTIFGIYPSEGSGGVMRRGTDLVAAGYVLYSSSCLLVLTVGKGTHGFTLDRSTGDFVLTHPNMEIPSRGQIYSVNDARYFDWPKGLQSYIDCIRKGEGQNPKQYSARYVCSLVADVHRTLLYGGVAMNPRSHLRLLYEANPMAFIVEQAGGKGTDGKRPLRSIEPEKLHQKLPVFLGSGEDIDELLSYEDVQQISSKTYNM